MKRFAALFLVAAVIMVAVPVSADDAVDTKAEEAAGQVEAKEAAAPAKCAKRNPFQSMGDSIKGCRPKVWLLQPMKPVEPVKKEGFSFFQKLADSVNRKCPAGAKGACAPCR